MPGKCVYILIGEEVRLWNDDFVTQPGFFVHALDNFRKTDIMEKVPAQGCGVKSTKVLQKLAGTKKLL